MCTDVHVPVSIVCAETGCPIKVTVTAASPGSPGRIITCRTRL